MKENTMKITAPNLTRCAALSAMVAGVMYVLVGLLHPFVGWPSG
jgi:hypothetical protein